MKSNVRRKCKGLKNRLKRGHQQREANYKESEKGVSRVISGVSLTLRPKKTKIFFNNRRLILASVCSSDHVSVKQ